MTDLDGEIGRLIGREKLPPDFASTVKSFYVPIVRAIESLHSKLKRTTVIGICGPQGSGKTTAAEFLQLLLNDTGLRTARFSIDDLYLTRAERAMLARDVHPLLQTRGPPGTHDVAMGLELVARLSTAATNAETPIPRFDKSVDDRAPQPSWPVFVGRADMILFEGWCVGALPQPAVELVQPINALERDEDRGGIWRRFVNDQLAGSYHNLFRKIDYLIMIEPPSFDCVLRWRTLQEAKLRERAPNAPHVMSNEQITRFIMFYERVSRHLLAEMPARAEAVLNIDIGHKVTGLRFKV